jgi:hypothetical protein
MKLQKLLTSLFALVLLALLQISAAAQTPSAQPQQSAPGENYPRQVSPISSAAPTPTLKNTPTPTTARGTTQSYYTYYYPEQVGNFSLAPWLEAISTFALVGFALWQMGFVRRSTSATETAATAAQKAAEAAEKALRADRPYLLIKAAKLDHFRTEHESASKAPVRVSFVLENFGKSPAIIEKIRARLAVTKTLKPIRADASLTDEEAFPEFGDYGRCAWVEPMRNVVGVGGLSDTYSSELATYRRDVTRGHIATETFNRITAHALIVVLHGFVRYTDVLQRKHETEFRGLYNPPSADQPMGSFNFQFDDHPQPENEGG